MAAMEADQPTIEELMAQLGPYEPSPPPSVRSSIAAGLQGMPIPSPNQAGGGARFVYGLAHGFATAQQQAMDRESEIRKYQNALRLKASQLEMEAAKERSARITPEEHARQVGMDEAAKLAVQRQNTPRYPLPTNVENAIHRAGLTGPLDMVSSEELNRLSRTYTPEDFWKPASGINTGTGEGFDAEALADALHDGRIPPTMINQWGRTQSGLVGTAFAKKYPKDNISERIIDFEATKAFWKGRNSQRFQMTLANLERLPATIAVARNLVKDAKKALAQSNIHEFNRAVLITATNGVYGPRAQQVARDLMTHINDMQVELQAVYGNGYSPTDMGLKQAKENLAADWGYNELNAALDLAQLNIGIRRASFANTTPVTADNPLGVAQNPNQTMRMIDPKGVIHNVPYDQVIEARRRGGTFADQ